MAVSLIDRLPTRRPRTAPRHRAIDKVERLEVLLDGARMLIKGLRIQLEDQAAEHADAIARIDKRHAETVRGLEQQIAGLEHRLSVGVLAEHVVAKTQEIDVRSLRERFADGPIRSLHHSPQAGH